MGDLTIELYGNSLLNRRYTIIKSLGVGGFGITYQAYDNMSRVNCAIKEFFPRGIVTRLDDNKTVMPVSESKRDIYEHGMERFLEEAEILQRLNHVPSVVSVYDFFQENGTCYFVMEYLEGKTLSSILKGYGRGLPYDTVADAIGQVGQALIQVHRHNYFHRDISPDNIFVTNSGRIKLIDFGSAKNIARNENQVLSVVLKPGFAPPEQYSSKGVQGTFTDVYALASTMYYLLTGKMFPGAFDRKKDEDYVQLKEYGFSTEVSDAVNKALRLNFRQRTQTVGEFLRDLNLVNSLHNQGVPSSTKAPTVQGEPDAVAPKGAYIKPSTTSSRKKKPILAFQNGDQYQLPADELIVVGRSSDHAQIIIEEAHISKKHCEIYYDGNRNIFYITDDSTNGTFVNGEKLERKVRYQVTPGSIVAIGGKNCVGKVGVSVE